MHFHPANWYINFAAATQVIFKGFIPISAVIVVHQKFGHMVSYLNYQIGAVTIEEAVGELRRVPPDSQTVRAAREVGIYFGD